MEKICTCGQKAGSADKILKCHDENCPHGAFFHLTFMGYKRFPNNAKITWKCPQCSLHVLAKKCAAMNGNNYANSDPICTLDDVTVIKAVCNGSDTDKVSSLGTLSEKEFSLINSSSGWLDCTVIHHAQILLKKIDPLIEGFQRPTLGSCNNFDVVGGEFIQILNTGANHWVCISSVGCRKGCANVYDGLFNNVINDDIEEQTRNLVGDEFERLIIVPVQQQKNGSDCGVFSIAYATSLVCKEAPETVMYDHTKMRPHLLKCLQTGVIKQFPTSAVRF